MTDIYGGVRVVITADIIDNKLANCNINCSGETLDTLIELVEGGLKSLREQYQVQQGKLCIITPSKAEKAIEGGHN